jgi:hypothetical protein
VEEKGETCNKVKIEWGGNGIAMEQIRSKMNDEMHDDSGTQPGQ